MLTDDREAAVRGAASVYTDVWVALGEAPPLPSRSTARRSNRRATRGVKFMHCLPAFHDENTVVGREIMERTGMKDGLEVGNEVFQGPASIVFEQAENRLHTIEAILLATFGSG